jgi:hypothetical protein
MPTAQITQFGRSDAAQVTAVLLGQNGGSAGVLPELLVTQCDAV